MPRLGNLVRCPLVLTLSVCLVRVPYAQSQAPIGEPGGWLTAPTGLVPGGHLPPPLSECGSLLSLLSFLSFLHSSSPASWFLPTGPLPIRSNCLSAQLQGHWAEAVALALKKRRRAAGPASELRCRRPPTPRSLPG